MTKKITPNDLIEFLTYSFSKFDHCVTQFRLQKLSTFLDEYIVIGGLSDSKYDFEISCSNFVFSILEEVENLNKEKDLPEEILKFFPLTLNIGISTGNCIGGFINLDENENQNGGIDEEFQENNYNIFGESLDISKELKNYATEKERIIISKNTFDLIKNRFECEEFKKIKINEEIGEIETFVLKEKKKFFSVQK